MKSILLVCVAACLFSTAFAQNDTTIKKETDTTIKKETKNDTIHIGGMIIIKKPGSEDREIITHDHHTVHIPRRRTPENLTTNWWIIDIGFSGFNDKTCLLYTSPSPRDRQKSR